MPEIKKNTVAFSCFLKDYNRSRHQAIVFSGPKYSLDQSILQAEVFFGLMYAPDQSECGVVSVTGFFMNCHVFVIQLRFNLINFMDLKYL